VVRLSQKVFSVPVSNSDRLLSSVAHTARYEHTAKLEALVTPKREAQK